MTISEPFISNGKAIYTMSGSKMSDINDVPKCCKIVGNKVICNERKECGRPIKDCGFLQGPKDDSNK